MIYWTFRFLFWLGLKLFHRFESIGDENIPRQGGGILVSNHASFIDPVALGCGTRRRKLAYIARDTLTEHWLYRLFIRRLDVISIDRKSGHRDALATMTRAVQDGHLCVIFPEGTRCRDGKMAPFKQGAARLAMAADVPVVPAYVEGSFRAWPRHSRVPRLRGRVRVRYGQPFRIEPGVSRRAATEQIRQAILALASDQDNSTDASSGSVRTTTGGTEQPDAKGCGPAAKPTSMVEAVSND